MIGLPIPILRPDDTEETVYLSTRRSGESGAELQEARRRYRGARLKAAKAATRLGLIMARVRELDEGAGMAADLLTLCDESERLTDVIHEAQCEAQDAAEAAARIALEENHGPDAIRILDGLSDAQITGLMTALETGEAPADFFPCPATRRRPSSITPGGAPAGANSSKPALPAPTSKPAP